MSSPIALKPMTSNGDPGRSASTHASQAAPILDAYSQAVIDVAERLRPTVVNVSVWGRRRSPWEDPPSGNGSGVVFAPDGLIVTNNHVVEGTRKLELTFADGEEAEAELLGADAASDLAVLRANASDLPAAVSMRAPV